MVELLVAMVLMFVVMGAIYGIWFGLQRTYSFTEDDMRAQREAQTALAEMVELIRTARLPESRSKRGSERRHTLGGRQHPHLLDRRRPGPESHSRAGEVPVETSSRTLYRDTDVGHTNDPPLPVRRPSGSWETG